jgi:hypothetical protein
MVRFTVRVLIFITRSLRLIEVSLKNAGLRSRFSRYAQTTFSFAQNISFSLKLPTWQQSLRENGFTPCLLIFTHKPSPLQNPSKNCQFIHSVFIFWHKLLKIIKKTIEADQKITLCVLLASPFFQLFSFNLKQFLSQSNLHRCELFFRETAFHSTFFLDAQCFF